jgi:hypothetical protein
MADTGKDATGGSETNGFTPEVQESDNHQLAQALQRTTDTLLELRYIIETMQRDIAEERVPKVGLDVQLERALAVISTTKTTATEAQIEPSHIDETTEADITEERVTKVGQRVMLELVRSAVAKITTLPIEITQQHLLPPHNKATEASHIPEVAEKILSHLGAEDLLRVQQVDRKIFKIIEASPSLQTAMFLKPRLTGPFAMFPPTAEVGVSQAMWGGHTPVYLHGEVLTVVDPTGGAYGTSNDMFLSIQSGARLVEEKVGARVASMLVCQPPIYVMHVTMMCCSRCRPDPSEIPADRFKTFVLKAKHGITIGHMVESIKTIRKLHDLCDARWVPFVGDDMEDVTEPSWPEFETIITLEPHDPLFVRGLHVASCEYLSEQDGLELERMNCK